MLRLASIVSLAILTLTACGGSTDNDPNGTGGGGSGGNGAVGGSGATGGGGVGGSGAVGGTGATGAVGGTGATGGAGGSGGVPNACSVPSAGPGPYKTTFHFTNDSPEKLFLRGYCQLEMTVSSCAGNYADDLALSGDCTVDCNTDPTGGCIACGACPILGQEVTPTTPYDRDWSGLTYTFSQTSEGCPCHVGTPAAAAKYRVTVPVYASEAEAQNGTPLREVSIDFTLPAPGGVVEVPLAATF